jgi:hypothetical protein
MPELLTTADFEQRVVKVSERLDAMRGAARFGTTIGGLPYIGIDLTSELPELAQILASLIHQDPEEPLTTNARLEVGGRRLALAAITGLLLQGDGMADFPARYKALMGVEPEYELFERLLPAAMREAGLPLPAKPEPKRLLETLLVVAGLPKALMQAVAEYFVVYWRLFHPQDDVLAPLAAAADAPAGWAGLDAEGRAALAGLAKRLLPNAGVVGPVVSSLANIMNGLRAQPKWRIGDLFTQAEAIRGLTGCDPKKLLQNDEEALAVLVAGLDKAWHPDQFRHVMMSFARGSEVRLPSGSLAMVDKAIAVPQWGLYRIEHKTYMVLPNEGLALEDVEGIFDGKADSYGSRVVWRGAAEPEVRLDGWPDMLAARPLYVEKAARGWLFLDVPPAARVLQFGDQILPPRPGVHWGASLWANVDAEGKATLNVRLVGLRVCLPELAGRTLQLECPQAETAGRLTFELDERGIGGLGDRVLPLTAPTPGHVELVLQDHAEGDSVKLDGRKLHHKLPLAEIILAAEATGELVPASEDVRPYGLPSYIVLSSRPVNTGAMQMRDISVEPLGKIGDYEFNRLKWADPAQALELYIDGRHQWNFSYRVDVVWQAGELPKPPAPFAFAPETPHGFTVTSADQLFVDDMSLVENPLVTLSRDGQPLFTHTWAELNWLMNFPVENRRLSGAMLRKALNVGPDYDLAGVYMLLLTAGGELLGERYLTILPAMDVSVAPKGIVDEEAVYTVIASCPQPIFPGGKTRAELVLGRPVVDRDTMENSPFQPKALEGKLVLQVPRTEVPMAVTPDVGGFRLLDDNEGTWVRKTMLGYDELGHMTLVLFAANGAQGTLNIGEETLTEDFYEGFATFSLGEIQGRLRENETEVRVAIDGRAVGELTVVWHPKIVRFEAASEYLLEGVAQIDLAVEGPQDVPVRLEATSPDGKVLTKLDVETDGNLDRVVSLPVPGGKDHPVITVKIYVPSVQSGMAAGTVEIRNAAFEPEIEALNARIAAEPRAAELRYERAQLLIGKGLRKAAARDFQAAIDLGMTELLDSPQYQQFLTQRRAEGFHEDLKALASFFVPFARKELYIG